MNDCNDIVKAYTGFSVSKYASIYGLSIDMVLEEVLKSYDTTCVDSRHELLLSIGWDFLEFSSEGV